MRLDAASLLQSRRFVRAPIPLFRAGLGFLFTRRLLMHVSTGFARRHPAVATVLGEAESQAVLARYQEQHPGAWEKLAAIIVEATGDPDPDIPLVRLTLADH